MQSLPIFHQLVQWHYDVLVIDVKYQGQQETYMVIIYLMSRRSRTGRHRRGTSSY